MTDRPILFSASMIRALLDGRKTQTRRVIHFPGVDNVIEFVQVSTDRRSGIPIFEIKDATGKHLTRPAGKGCVTPHYSPRFANGDRLYVRETWSADRLMEGFKPRDMLADSPVWYWADGNPTEGDWITPKPGIHMPRWAGGMATSTARSAPMHPFGPRSTAPAHGMPTRGWSWCRSLPPYPTSTR